MKKNILFCAFAAALVVSASGIALSGGRPLSAPLSGEAEAPGPGDADGSGMVELTVNPGQEEICYTLTVSDIEEATAAHIHIGDPGEPGPVVVTLEAPSDGSSEGCVEVDRELALEILKNPGNYYVNVHNAAYPAGAVRGQLAPADDNGNGDENGDDENDSKDR